MNTTPYLIGVEYLKFNPPFPLRGTNLFKNYLLSIDKGLIQINILRGNPTFLRPVDFCYNPQCNLAPKGSLVETQKNGPNISPLRVSCPNCRLGKLCLPQGLNPAEMAQLDDIVKHCRPLQRGAHFFRQGDELRALYVVTSGSVKNYVTSPDGTEQIIGFYLPGELLGLDALEHRRHTSSAVTLERTFLCEMPYGRFEELCTHMPHLTRQILVQTGRELTHDHEIRLLMGQKGVEERLALFLLSLSDRHKARGFSETEFNLSMSRYDIANFLGVAAETVSRTLSRFEKDGLLRVERKLVRIVDLPRLRAIAGFCGECVSTAAS